MRPISIIKALLKIPESQAKHNTHPGFRSVYVHVDDDDRYSNIMIEVNRHRVNFSRFGCMRVILAGTVVPEPYRNTITT